MEKRILECLILLPVMLFASCASKTVVFADKEWNIDRSNGCLVSNDGVYNFTFGTTLVNPDMAIVASETDLGKYSGLSRYLGKILDAIGMSGSEVIAYVPERETMWVKLDSVYAHSRPKSITIKLDEEHPYTMWVGGDEKWDRTANEMYTYTYCLKRQKLLIIADVFDYGDEPLARITLLQTDTRRFRKIGLPKACSYPYNTVSMDCIEMISNWVDGHRDVSISDYRAGQFPAALPHEEQNVSEYLLLIGKADSCYMTGKYVESACYFRNAFRHSDFLQGKHLYNAACAASLAGQTNIAFTYLFRRAKTEPEWYISNPEEDQDLKNLRSDFRWAGFVDEVNRRKTAIEEGYDHELREELLEIAKTDQEVRYEYLNAINNHPEDKLLTDSLAGRMHEIDSLNLIKIDKILKEHGWPSRKIVGDANQAIWLVVQHSNRETIKRWLPLFHDAAGKGELGNDFVAMMDDRCAVWSGKPQKYGTQGYMRGGKFVVNTLLDAGKVDEWRKEAGLPPLDE